jgi:hypothetical protein
MSKRQSNNPKCRIAPAQSLTLEEQDSLLKKARYVGSAIHKRVPSNYGFHPPSNPRATKAVCDDLRVIPFEEAQILFMAGIRKSMVSTYREESGLPKYVWAVDAQGEVYEAKTGNGGYHGYRLDEATEKHMRAQVLDEWVKR